MTKVAKSNSINRIISSAKRNIRRSIIVSTAAMSLTACGTVDETIASIESIEKTVEEKTSTVREVNEGLAEKIDQVEKIDITEMFSTSEEKYAGEDANYYDEEGNPVAGIVANTILKLIGKSEDGEWYETEDGFYVKSDEIEDEAITVVIPCSEKVYTQYSSVKVHSTYDKTSDTVYTLAGGTLILKSGEVDFGGSKLDSTGDHGWSEVKFKADGEVIVGYVYTDYLGTEKPLASAEATEAPAYTEEEKAELLAEAGEYDIDTEDITTDEDYYELESEIKKAANLEEIGKAIQEYLEKRYAESGAGTSSSTVDTSTGTDWFDIYTYTHMPASSKYYKKPYDHAASNAYYAELEAKAEAERQAAEEEARSFDDAHGGVVSKVEEAGPFEYDGETWARRYVITYGDGTVRYLYREH